jgi:hypothetical protein
VVVVVVVVFSHPKNLSLFRPRHPIITPPVISPLPLAIVNHRKFALMSCIIRIANHFLFNRLAFMKDILPKYFSSEWSFATCHVQSDTRFLCTFSPDQRSVIVITMQGDYYQFAFDPLTSGRGDCKRLAFHRFMDDDDD